MSFEAYRVAVRLSLVNGVSTGLIAMMGQFRTLDKSITSTAAGLSLVEREMSKIKRLGIIGGAVAGTGAFGLSLFRAPLEEAKKFDQAVGKFKLFGMGDAVNAEAVQFAKGMNVIGTSYTENMKLMTEAQGVFRESGIAGSAALEGAKLAAPMLAKIQFSSAGLDEESKAKMKTQSLAMLRFVEMRGGLKDAETFNRIADSGWKAIQSSGGNVNFEQLRQFMARGGVAAQGLSDAALYGKLEPVIGELKGSTAGNAWMTSYNRLVGGVRIPNQVAHMLADSGIWDKSKIEWNSMGGIKQFKGNPLKDMATLSSDPVAFYEKNILPMYAKRNGGKGLDVAERGRENTMIFGRTGGMMFSLIDRQLATIHRSTDAWQKALGVDPSSKVASQTLAGKEVALEANWKRLQLALGETILPMAIKGVDALSTALQSFTAFAKEYPTTFKVLTYSFLGLSAAMAFGGTVMLLSAGFKALQLAVSFVGLGGVGGILKIAGGIRTFGAAMLFSNVGGSAGLLKLGSSLTTLAGALGLVMQAAAVFMAAYAGWKLGGWINDKIDKSLTEQNGGKPTTLGGLYYDRLHHADGSFRWQGIFSTETPAQAEQRHAAEQNGGKPTTVTAMLPTGWNRPLTAAAPLLADGTRGPVSMQWPAGRIPQTIASPSVGGTGCVDYPTPAAGRVGAALGSSPPRPGCCSVVVLCHSHGRRDEGCREIWRSCQQPIRHAQGAADGPGQHANQPGRSQDWRGGVHAPRARGLAAVFIRERV